MKTFIIILVVLFLFYIFLISPTVRKVPLMEELKKYLYAHRGLHDNSTDAPENSMRAFAKAVDAGYGIELDIQLSKDKVPVVFHDFTLKRICGVEGKVEDYTFTELQQFSLCGTDQKIPRFEEVLKLVDGKVPLIVELKIEGKDVSVCQLGNDILSRYQGDYCIESFNPNGVRWYRKNRPDVIRGQLSDGFIREGEYIGIIYLLLEYLCFNVLTKPDFIAYNRKYPNNLSRLICHNMFHNTAVAWTIKSQEQLDAARKNFDIFIFDSFIPIENKYHCN